MTKTYANESYDLEQYIRLAMRQLNCTPKTYLHVLARRPAQIARVARFSRLTFGFVFT